MVQNVENLKYWVQRVLPQVYDDSLSFYELLNKVVAKLNELIDKNNEYFSQDFTEFVRTILTEWKEDGTLESIINQELFEGLNTKIDTLGVYVDTYKLAVEVDDTGALRRAVEDAMLLSQPILFSNREYLITRGLTDLITDDVWLQGVKEGTTIVLNTNDVFASNVPFKQLNMAGLTFKKAEGLVRSGAVIVLDKLQRSEFIDLRFENLKDIFQMTSCYFNEFHNIFTLGCENVFTLGTPSDPTISSNANYFSNITCANGFGKQIQVLHNSRSNRFDNIDIEDINGNVTDAFVIQNANHNYLDGLHFEFKLGSASRGLVLADTLGASYPSWNNVRNFRQYGGNQQLHVVNGSGRNLFENLLSESTTQPPTINGANNFIKNLFSPTPPTIADGNYYQSTPNTINDRWRVFGNFAATELGGTDGVVKFKYGWNNASSQGEITSFLGTPEPLMTFTGTTRKQIRTKVELIAEDNFRVPQQVPTTEEMYNGMIWTDAAGTKLYARLAGVTREIALV